MLKNIKTINKRKRGNMDKQLNNYLTSIGDNTIKNEITSMSIVQRNNELFQENKFKVNNDSIYSMLGIKAPNQILTETRGFETVDRINMERKRLVDRIILPLANFKNLVESDKEKATKWLCRKNPKIITPVTKIKPKIKIIKLTKRVPWSGHSAKYAVNEIYNQITNARKCLIFVNTRSQSEFLFILNFWIGIFFTSDYANEGVLLDYYFTTNTLNSFMNNISVLIYIIFDYFP